MYLKQLVFSSYLIVSSFASQSHNTVSGQSYRKIDFPLQVWNNFSSDQTEEVSFGLNSGTIECGLACHKNANCGGFLFDKASGSCFMKHVNKYFHWTFNLFSFDSFLVYKTCRLLLMVRTLWQFMLKMKDWLHFASFFKKRDHVTMGVTIV